MRIATMISALGMATIMAASGQAHERPEIECEVVKVQSGSNLELIGRVRSSAATSGSYMLDIINNSRAGSSNISQSGDFEAKPNQVVNLGTALISQDASARHSVRLVIKWPGGQKECVSSVRDLQALSSGAASGSSGSNKSVSLQSGGGNKATVVQRGSGNSSTIIQSR